MAAAKAKYLVIGAGTAGLSFIDSILTLDAKATVILVDRFSQPGGHWTKAYPFVLLHQASCSYGVNSLPLSNTNNRDKKGNERFSVSDLASGEEILDYFKVVLEQFRDCGRVQLYFSCEYSQGKSGNHIWTNIDNGQVT
jgi:cation diffusion facilitator CzcD-associated flavoprotein CzcO